MTSQTNHLGSSDADRYKRELERLVNIKDQLFIKLTYYHGGNRRHGRDIQRLVGEHDQAVRSFQSFSTDSGSSASTTLPTLPAVPNMDEPAPDVLGPAVNRIDSTLKPHIHFTDEELISQEYMEDLEYVDNIPANTLDDIYDVTFRYVNRFRPGEGERVKAFPFTLRSVLLGECDRLERAAVFQSLNITSVNRKMPPHEDPRWQSAYNPEFLNRRRAISDQVESQLLREFNQSVAQMKATPEFMNNYKAYCHGRLFEGLTAGDLSNAFKPIGNVRNLTFSKLHIRETFALAWLAGIFEPKMLRLKVGMEVPDLLVVGTEETMVGVSMLTGYCEVLMYSQLRGSVSDWLCGAPEWVIRHFSKFEQDIIRKTDTAYITMQPRGASEFSQGLYEHLLDVGLNKIRRNLDAAVFTTEEEKAEYDHQMGSSVLQLVTTLSSVVSFCAPGVMGTLVGLAVGLASDIAQIVLDDNLARTTDQGDVYMRAKKSAAMGRFLIGLNAIDLFDLGGMANKGLFRRLRVVRNHFLTNSPKPGRTPLVRPIQGGDNPLNPKPSGGQGLTSSRPKPSQRPRPNLPTEGSRPSPGIDHEVMVKKTLADEGLDPFEGMDAAETVTPVVQGNTVAPVSAQASGGFVPYVKPGGDKYIYFPHMDKERVFDRLISLLESRKAKGKSKYTPVFKDKDQADSFKQILGTKYGPDHPDFGYLHKENTTSLAHLTDKNTLYISGHSRPGDTKLYAKQEGVGVVPPITSEELAQQIVDMKLPSNTTVKVASCNSAVGNSNGIPIPKEYMPIRGTPKYKKIYPYVTDPNNMGQFEASLAGDFETQLVAKDPLRKPGIVYGTLGFHVLFSRSGDMARFDKKAGRIVGADFNHARAKFSSESNKYNYVDFRKSDMKRGRFYDPNPVRGRDGLPAAASGPAPAPAVSAPQVDSVVSTVADIDAPHSIVKVGGETQSNKLFIASHSDAGSLNQVRQAVSESGAASESVDVLSFSQGPGLNVDQIVKSMDIGGLRQYNHVYGYFDTHGTSPASFIRIIRHSQDEEGEQRYAITVDELMIGLTQDTASLHPDEPAYGTMENPRTSWGEETQVGQIHVYHNPKTGTTDYFEAQFNGRATEQNRYYFPQDRTSNQYWKYMGGEEN
ncbi:hypothetical protein F0225_18790 [Vibrio pectenicida]|uniref:Uncharacterized protein n=1 Tax=Vibrio pectenicida TaxID=62763 RepID=A0A7Y4A277_9VIBR|nr:hypothetical protein [Vibrio pectenicida]NOH73365.1 hypothetical protein [Vibrio pectenicida]